MNAESRGPHRVTVTPYLCVRGAAQAIEFYETAFGARETYPRIVAPDGKVGHAEITIGDTLIMLSDEHPDYGALAPPSLGGSSVSLMIAVADADAAVERAVAAGATLRRAVADQFYGERSGIVEDPFGYRWFLSAHIEDLSEQEVLRRAAAAYAEGA